MKSKILKHWVLLLFLLHSCSYLLGVIRVGSTVWGDSIYYYAYTRSMILDQDIHFANESVEPSLPFPNPPRINSTTNRVENNFSPGTGILWIPGFLLGQVLSFSPSGYSLITQVFVGLSAVGFGVLGLFFFARGLQNFFAQKIVAYTTVGLLLTTQLLYYLALDPLNSHSASFMLASLSFWLWATIWKNKTMSLRQGVLLGLSLGFLALVRNQEVLTGIVLLTSLLFRLRPTLFILGRVAAAAIVATITVSIQLATSWILYQSLQSPYVLNGQSLSWLQPDFFRVLFSSQNGFFYYAPIALLSLFGLFVYRKTNHFVSLVCSLVFVLQLYVIASWGPEIIGGPYGSRMFVGTLPFLGVGLAHVLQKVNARWLISIGSLLFIWNIAQIGIMIIRW